MPSKRRVYSLKEICINNLINNLETYWFKKTKIKETVDKINNRMLYFIGPFESLNDVLINYILKTAYEKAKFTKYHIYLFLNTHLKKLDLSFNRRANLIDSRLCSYFGVNSFNLIELNLSYQKDLTPLSLCEILKNQKHLKRLNLTQTQTNDKVLQLIANRCQNLEELCLSDCKSIYDDCLLHLTSCLTQKLTILNVDFIYLTEDCIKEILVNCYNLKFFYTENLVKIIHNLHTTGPKLKYKFNLETIYCDNTQIYLHEDLFQSLVFSCPKLKCLHINSLGSNEILSNLDEFTYLNQLLISNENVLTYKFDNYLLNYLSIHGLNLKKLHLIHIYDTNLRLILQTCSNLSELNVEFIHYYIPAQIDNDYELTLDEEKLLPDLKYLHTLSLSNANCTTTKPYLNMALFKYDIKLLIKKAVNLRNLKLDSFNFIDDEYFINLIKNSFQTNAKTLEKFELVKINNLNFKPIYRYLLFNEDNFNDYENRFKRLKCLNLYDCKLITKTNYQTANKRLKAANINCEINWS